MRLLNGYPNVRTYGKTDTSIGSPWQSDTYLNGWCDMNDDIITYCDIYECNDCPRYGDDCDGEFEEEEEWE